MTTQATSKATNKEFHTITEGSVTMRFPADQATTVFYNPVQVQNRDLSVLMISLFAEERAVELAVQRKKVQLKKERAATAAAGEPTEDKPPLKQLLEEYRQELLPKARQLLQEQDVSNDGLNILDALAASGLRSIRYWKEIPGVRHVTVNDIEVAAVERARQNCTLNGIEPKDGNSAPSQTPGVVIQRGDAIQEMYQSRKPLIPDLYSSHTGDTSDATNGNNDTSRHPNSPRSPRYHHPWNVIDLDPYGSSAPFLDAALQAIEEGGLLCVTCTDMRALGGGSPETCYGRYAAIPIQRAGYLQEMAVRILLQFMATTAAKYGRIIRPRLSVGMDFYVRVFVTVHEDRNSVRDLSLRIGKVFQSTQCQSFVIVPEAIMGGDKGNVFRAARAPSTCEETGASYKIGGPLWLGPMHDKAMVGKALERLSATKGGSSKPDLQYITTKNRLQALLQHCAEELPDVPLFYRVNDMARLCKMSPPPLADIHAFLLNAGYRVSGYHKDPNATKTDAPNHVLWDIIRAFAAKDPPKKPLPEDSAAHAILAKPIQTKVDFRRPLKGLRQKRTKTDVARFPSNPRANWGPRKKAKRR